jgi:uncharacterized protein (DUF1330 family)
MVAPEIVVPTISGLSAVTSPETVPDDPVPALEARTVAGRLSVCGSVKTSALEQERHTMSIYLIADITVTNDSWVPEYAADVHKIVQRHGGRYLSRSGNIATVEGAENTSTLIAIIEFPDRASLDAFASDPDYAPYGQARQAGSQSNFRVIDDTDLAGTIPYLPAA